MLEDRFSIVYYVHAVCRHYLHYYNIAYNVSRHYLRYYKGRKGVDKVVAADCLLFMRSRDQIYIHTHIIYMCTHWYGGVYTEGGGRGGLRVDRTNTNALPLNYIYIYIFIYLYMYLFCINYTKSEMLHEILIRVSYLMRS